MHKLELIHCPHPHAPSAWPQYSAPSQNAGACTHGPRPHHHALLHTHPMPAVTRVVSSGHVNVQVSLLTKDMAAFGYSDGSSKSSSLPVQL